MIRRIVRNISVVAVLSVFVFSVSCDSEDISDNATRLRIKLTDATSLVMKEFYIDITGIDLFVTDSVNTEGEWISLEYNGGEYNILKLRNGNTVQLVDQYFPADKNINKIRVLLGNNNRIITVTNEAVALQKSDNVIDGIIIDNIDADLAVNVITSIIIDINAALSVKEINGNFFLDPVSRAFPEIFGGSIKGYVAPPQANPFVAITQDNDTLLTIPESDGMFMFLGLNEGPWKIHIIADPSTLYKDTVFTDTLSMGQKLELTPKPIRLSFSTTEE